LGWEKRGRGDQRKRKRRRAETRTKKRKEERKAMRKAPVVKAKPGKVAISTGPRRVNRGQKQIQRDTEEGMEEEIEENAPVLIPNRSGRRKTMGPPVRINRERQNPRTDEREQERRTTDEQDDGK
jgi:hypothetical protein